MLVCIGAKYYTIILIGNETLVHIFTFQNYTEALEMCKQAYGDLHVLTGRINMNTGMNKNKCSDILKTK